MGKRKVGRPRKIINQLTDVVAQTSTGVSSIKEPLTLRYNDNGGGEDDDSNGPGASKKKRAASIQTFSFTEGLHCDLCCVPFESEFYYDLHMSSHDPDEQLYLERLGDDAEVWELATEESNNSHLYTGSIRVQKSLNHN